MILPHVITSPVATLSFPRKQVRVACTHCEASEELAGRKIDWLRIANFRVKHATCKGGRDALATR